MWPWQLILSPDNFQLCSNCPWLNYPFSVIMSLLHFLQFASTHCGLMMPYADIDLGQHWLRWWLFAWRHRVITRTNVELASVRSSDIHLRVISQRPKTDENYLSKFSVESPMGHWLKCHILGNSHNRQQFPDMTSMSNIKFLWRIKRRSKIAC